jgi:hypothetical protein
LLANEKTMMYEDYITIFNKKFNSFIMKSPCKVEVIQTPMDIIIKDKKSGKAKLFNFNFEKDVKQFINEIKVWLTNNIYPILTEVIREDIDYSQDEIKEMVKQGLDVDEIIFSKKQKVIENRYRVEKIILYSKKSFNQKDRLFIRNLETDIEELYELDMPGSTFLNGVLFKWTPEYAYKVFKGKANYLDTIDPNYKKGNNNG